MTYAPPPPNMPPPPGFGFSPENPKPWYLRKWTLIGGGVVVLLVIGAVAGAGSKKKPAATPASSSPAVVAPVVSAPPASAAPSSSTPPPSSTPPTAVAPTTATTAATPFVMPPEVGHVLQDAQDDIQRVSGNPSFFSHSADATGGGRRQILDRDWKVCAQNVPAGSTVQQDAYISFAVVKLDETCP